MFDIGIGEVFVILVVALFVFGPDRLPTMAKQAASFVRDLRTMVANARRDLSSSVGDLGIDEEDLRTLSDLRNPRSFVRKKVLDGVDLGLDDLGLDDDPKQNKSATRNGKSSAAAKTSSERAKSSSERAKSSPEQAKSSPEQAKSSPERAKSSPEQAESSPEPPADETPRFDPEAT